MDTSHCLYYIELPYWLVIIVPFFYLGLAGTLIYLLYKKGQKLERLSRASVTFYDVTAPRVRDFSPPHQFVPPDVNLSPGVIPDLTLPLPSYRSEPNSEMRDESTQCDNATDN